MVKILIKFWPIILPFLLLLLWYIFWRPRISYENVDRWKNRMVNLTLISALLIAIIMIVVMALSTEKQTDTNYTPAHVEGGGELVPASRDERKSK